MQHRATESGTRTTRRRPTAPRPIRRVARAARLSLEEFAEAVVAGQPRPGRPRDQAALLHWLGQSMRNEHPGVPLDELSAIMADRLRDMADGGNATAKAMLEVEADLVGLNMARIALALVGAPWAPDPPAVPKQQRIDSIAATVPELTGWSSVDAETIGAVYRWLFGDEALFMLGAEMRVEASLRILENPDLREVRLRHPETGELVLVTREDILEHTEVDGRVGEADGRYEWRQARWYDRLRHALRPHGDRSTSVGEAVERAAQDLGIERNGRSFEEFAGLVVAAAEARHG